MTEEKKYDNSLEVKAHILEVCKAMQTISIELLKRAGIHDLSKLEEPELELANQYIPILKELEYGSKEYKATLQKLSPMINHHYQNNRHHPEYHLNEINDMNLIDIIEMFCDWIAASKRQNKGCLERSIDISAKRFEISDQLKQILHNTRKEIVE